MAQFDSVRFGQAVRSKRGDRTMRDVLPEINLLGDVSLSTISRVERGSPPDLLSLEVLSEWMGVSPGTYFTTLDPQDADQDTMRRVETALREERLLSPSQVSSFLDLLAVVLDAQETNRRERINP